MSEEQSCTVIKDLGPHVRVKLKSGVVMPARKNRPGAVHKEGDQGKIVAQKIAGRESWLYVGEKHGDET